MKTIKEIEVKCNVVDKVFCNCCGKELCLTDCAGIYASLTASWGYDSNKDGESHSSDICESCYDKIVAQFKIPPAVSGNC